MEARTDARLCTPMLAMRRLSSTVTRTPPTTSSFPALLLLLLLLLLPRAAPARAPRASGGRMTGWFGCA
jgi:hypothetical protein